MLDAHIATVWRRAKNEPDFPQPIKAGPNTTVWVESEVAEWMQRQVRRARQTPDAHGAESPAAVA